MTKCERQMIGAREIYVKAVELFPHKWPWAESKLKEMPSNLLSIHDIEQNIPYGEAFNAVANFLSEQGWELEDQDAPDGLHIFYRIAET